MIEIKCTTKDYLSLEQMNPLQGELKTLTEKNYQKLKGQLIDEGFIAPFLVWKKNDEYFILDGHQRFYVLVKLKEQGIKIPEKFPVVLVEAENYRQACKRVLAISSQYGTMTDKGLKKFILDAEIDAIDVIEQFEFDVIDFEKWTDEQDEKDSDDDKKEKNNEIDLDELSEGLDCKCPRCGFEFNNDV